MNLDILADKSLLDPEILDSELMAMFEDCYRGLTRLAEKRGIAVPAELTARRAEILKIYEKSH